MEREERSSSKRLDWADAVKVVATLAVIALHSQRGVEPTDPPACFFLYYAARCAMPLFFMVNGAMILAKEDYSFEYCAKKILNMAKILVAWGLITGIYFLAFRGATPIEALKAVVLGALGKTDVLNVWFLYSFAVIYLVLAVPGVHGFVRKHAGVIAPSLACVCAVVAIASRLSIADGGFFVQAAVTQRFRLWTWFAYFVAGRALADSETTKSLPGFPVGLAAILATFAVVAMQYDGCWLATGTANSEYMYDEPLLFAWCVLIFATFMTNPRLSKAFAPFASISFGAFLLQSYLIDAFEIRGMATSPLMGVALWLAVAATCLSASRVLSRTPVRKIMTY